MNTESDPAMATVLHAFVNARTADEKRAMLKAHPELLGPGAEKILAHSASLEANKPQRPRFEHNRQLLELCRTIGVDAAFTPVPATPPGTPLGFVLQAFMNTTALEQKKAFLKAHPELLGPEVGEILRRGADERTQKRLDQYFRLFELCRKRGIDAAFEELERQRRDPDSEVVARQIVKVIGSPFLAACRTFRAIKINPRMNLGVAVASKEACPPAL